MRTFRLAWVLAVASFAACDSAGVDDSDAPMDFAEASDGVDAPADAEETDAGPPEDAAEEDVAGEEASPACSPLTVDELALVLSGDPDTAMDIVTNESPETDAFLHEVSDCVDPLDPDIVHLVARMRRTLAASWGGVGLAAPQVGLHRRIFLAQRTDQPGRPVQAFLNPTIVEYSADTASQMEGCLSVPGASPVVLRSLSVVLDYDGEDGWPVVGEAIGGARGTQAAYAARIVQHEYDHLEGILIVD
ncbi:MAG: peptide deformylase [Deltaproteobacteria bacterium]|nr:peptide deformylase [Deltaproteobacteria bacterium]